MGAFEDSLRLKKKIASKLITPAQRMRGLEQFVQERIREGDFDGAIEVIDQEMLRPGNIENIMALKKMKAKAIETIKKTVEDDKKERE